ncbi:type II secretion system protein [Bdellovibrio sp. 22V]|uniref:pilus assembly FimT family protein n=1 Tax=Bdellovibrio sp. 22V TaxID=3044166 RepID=UPI00254348FA|nr:type II secretion system protein [Bdellovibrio sp. 22V]WII71932.1 type II secretion system protein [Bdellovibrio sp. 22V]
MSQKGFTLIEIMIVLAIMGALIAIGVPRLMNKEENVKTVARHLLVLSKEIRNKARLTNSTYRLVIDMDPQEPKYWVEKASGPQKIDPELYEKEKEEEKGEDAPPPLFQLDKSLTKKEKVLPGKLRFISVETVNMKAPMTDGIAYIHFFPEGFVEAAAVQIQMANNSIWTLVFNPLTGQADIIEKAQSLKDIQR